MGGESEVLKMAEFFEAYRKLGDPEDRFDIDFWQKQGPKAIFEAAWEMIMDVQLLKEGHANEPQLQRTIEHFQKL
jgi:hypothetical protein